MRSDDHIRAEAETLAVLRVLALRPGERHTHYAGAGMPTVDHAFPPDWPTKRKLARLRRMVKRGLIGGCACGCRGDWTIYSAALVFLAGAVA